MCYILGLQVVTESTVINKTGPVPILREPTGLFYIYHLTHWLSL